LALSTESLEALQSMPKNYSTQPATTLTTCKTRMHASCTGALQAVTACAKSDITTMSLAQ